MVRQLPESVYENYASKGKTAALSAPAGKQLALFNARAYNNSGSTLSVGICRKLTGTSTQMQYKIFKKIASAQTEITSSVLGGTASGIFTATNSDGFYLQTARKIGLLGLTISTAQAGGVFTYAYWNGSSFTTLTTLEVPTDYSGTGDVYIVFRAPSDWSATDTSVTGLDTNKYTIRVLGTTGPAGVVSVNAMWVAEFLELYSGVVNNAAVQLSFPDSKPFELEAEQSLFPYFSTASASNAFAAYYASV